MGKRTIEVTQLRKSSGEFGPADIGKLVTVAPDEVEGRASADIVYAQCPVCGFVGVMPRRPGEPYHAYSCQNCSSVAIA